MDFPENWPTHPEQATRCRKLARLLLAGKVTFEEYAYNAMLALVCAPDDDFPACVDSIPAGHADAFADYLRAELEPVDFMPSPGAFIVDFSVPGIEDRTKRQLRPRFLRLYRAVCGDPEPIVRPTTVTASSQGP